MTAKEFIQSLPAKVAKEALEGQNTVFHFEIEGPGGGKFTVQVEDGQMKVSEGLEGEARCKVSASDQNFVKVVKGDLNPTMAVMMGKIKISNLGEMMKYSKLFGL